VWNVRFPRVGKWKGYQNPSSNSAWVDRIRSLDGSIVGATTVRNISL
jgi:hypothetical protein